MNAGEIRQALEQASHIVQQGWTQGRHTDGRGSYCLKGAIGLATGFLEDRCGELAHRDLGLETLRLERHAVEAVCRQLRPMNFRSIPVFNDDPATTQADVLAVLEKAIASC